MRREIVVKFSIDPTEYEQAIDSPEGAIELATAMFNNEADFPDSVTLSVFALVKAGIFFAFATFCTSPHIYMLQYG
jgi:hypothetical protein